MNDRPPATGQGGPLPLTPGEPLPTTGHHVLIPDWPTQAEQTGQVILGAEAANHYHQVLRIQCGEGMSLTDGAGHIAQAVVRVSSKRSMSLEVLTQWTQAPWPECLTLVLGISKGKKLDEVIRRAAELGVDQVYPIHTQRCDRKLDAGKVKAQGERWQAIADSACAQSRRSWAMRVHPVDSPWEQTGREQSGSEQIGGSRFVLWEGATATLHQAFTSPIGGDLTLIVGPEGGLSAGEVERWQATPVRLGGTILRTETAGIAAATLGAWHLGRLGV